MPPASQSAFDPTDHLLPPAHNSGAGPIVGIVIIIAILIVGALYFWGQYLDELASRQTQPVNNPMLPSVNSTATIN